MPAKCASHLRMSRSRNCNLVAKKCEKLLNVDAYGGGGGGSKGVSMAHNRLHDAHFGIGLQAREDSRRSAPDSIHLAA